MKLNYSILALMLVATVAAPVRKTKIFLVGDSTMSIKEIKAYPETGWGMPFANFFDSTIEVDNRAKNGRSTKSFVAEGLWKLVLDDLHEGDYVFIQFGHNDQAITKGERYSPPDTFKLNLIRYVTDVRMKKGIPILFTPVARRRFDDKGQVLESHPVYSDAVIEVARKENVPLIDLNAKSKMLLQQFGKENSALLYLHLEPNEHPNYPEGKIDDTHFNELGARRMAELVLAEIRSLNLPIAAHIRNAK